jgi:hypothetical protein
MRMLLRSLVPSVFILMCCSVSAAQQDTIYFDSSSGNYIIHYACRFVFVRGADNSLRLLGEEGLLQGEEMVFVDSNATVVFEPGTKLSPRVTCITTRGSTGAGFLYSYALENGAESVQNLKWFVLEIGTDDVTDQSTAWRGTRMKAANDSGVVTLRNWMWVGDQGLEPSWRAHGFALASPGLPRIERAYFRGRTPILEFPTEAPGGDLGRRIASLRSIPNDYVQRMTVGPGSLPTVFRPLVLLDTLSAYVREAQMQGWIVGQLAVDKYLESFGTARTQLQVNDNGGARTTLQSVLHDVDQDSSTTLTSEAYALIRYNTEYLLAHIPEPGLAVKLLSSTGAQLTGGTLQYYEGSWKDAVSHNDGTFSVNTTLHTVSLRMTYAYGIQTKSNVAVGPDTALFQTVNSTARLVNSQNVPIDTGSVQYYAGAWRSFGTTSGGVATKELLPSTYSFRMTYAFGSIDKQQNTATNATVVFQTVAATVRFFNSAGSPLDQGTVQYYSGAWRDFGTTASGTVAKELLPRSYSFRMTHAFTSIDKAQDLASSSTVNFSTVLCTVRVKNAQSQPVNGALASYYAGAWRQIGSTVNGELTKELLPVNLTFRASSGGTSQDKAQNLSTNPVVEFVIP